MIELRELSELSDNGHMNARVSPPRKKAHVVDPPNDFGEMFKLARYLESHSEPAVLVGPDGEQIPLPLEAYEVLQQVVHAMEQGAAVSVEPIDRQMTTQQAASLLGISRSTIVRLLDEHELPYERLGESRHRRLRLRDVLAYRDRKRTERRDRLDEMTRQAHEDGLYDTTPSDYQAALAEARKS